MGDAQPTSPDVGVLIDPSQRDRQPRELWDARRLPIATIEELEAGEACRAVESQARLIVLDGDDRLVSRALTVYQRRHRGREQPLEFLPLDAGRFTRIADEVGAPAPTARFAERLAEGGIHRQTTSFQRRALRVTTSSRPAPIWGFSAGSGLFFRIFEMLQRSEGGGLTGLRSVVSELAEEWSNRAGRRFETIGARVSVDYTPRSEELGYLVASGLEETWLGLPSAREGRPGWQGSATVGELFKAVAGAATLPDFLAGTSTESFHRIHIDGPGGFVVDGELYESDEPHVLQIAPGPQCTFAGLS